MLNITAAQYRGDSIERIAHDLQIQAPRLSDDEALALALKLPYPPVLEYGFSSSCGLTPSTLANS